MTSHSTIQVSPRGFLAGRARRAVAAVAGALLLVTGAGVVAMTNAEAATPTLPFDLVQTSGSKVVFAHYFTPYPVSLDNADPSSDYYARNYLTPNGESGKHAAYGGLLRDRPLTHAVRSESNWLVMNMQDEIAQAKAAGINAFFMDIMVNPAVGRRNRAWEAREILDAFTDLERGLASPTGDTRAAEPVRRVPARPPS